MRNALRIISNPYKNHLSYYFLNEAGIWVVCSDSSPLSRHYYTYTKISERAAEIVSKIDEVYNKNNKGLDIVFEGTSDDYSILNNTVKTLFPEKDICCLTGMTKIAVVGKRRVGKTFLIEGMEGLLNYKYRVEKVDNYYRYIDEGNHAEWYEIEGIDYTDDSIAKTYETLCELIDCDLSNVVYCLNATVGKIEDIEKDLIKRIVNEHPQVSVMVAVTYTIGETESFVDEIKKITDQIKVVLTLAKEVVIDISQTGEHITIEPFGLNELSQYIFERR